MKRAEIEKLLPGVFQRTLRKGNPLDALIEIMEALHEPSENILRNLDNIFDPYRSRADFLPFLARWVDLEWLLEKPTDTGPAPLCQDPISTGTGRLRELISAASHLSQWRGTSKGLLLFLQIATGMNNFQVDEEIAGKDGQPRPFHIVIIAPEAAIAHRRLIERIIKKEKPAYVTFELDFGQNDAKD